VIAAITLVTGIIVLGGAIAAGHRRRVYDAVVLKVLGASRRELLLASLIEHGLLGLAAALVAAALGTAAAYLLVTGPMRSDWVLLPGPLALVLALALVVTFALGYAGTWLALASRPAAYLRNE
jgi:putative ABC transport system permease protein